MAKTETLKDQQILLLYKDEFLPKVKPDGEWKNWLREYIKTLDAIRAHHGDLTSKDAQQVLWEDNGVSGAGMCSVQLAPAIEDESFRKAVSEALVDDLPKDL